MAASSLPNFLIHRPQALVDEKDDSVVTEWIAGMTRANLCQAITDWVASDQRRAYRMNWGKREGIPFRFPAEAWKSPYDCTKEQLVTMALYFFKHPDYVPQRQSSKRRREQEDLRQKQAEEWFDAPMSGEETDSSVEILPNPLPPLPLEIPGDPLPLELRVGDWIAVDSEHALGFPAGKKSFNAVITKIYTEEELKSMYFPGRNKSMRRETVLLLNVNWPVLPSTKVCKLPECRHKWSEVRAYQLVGGREVNYREFRSIYAIKEDVSHAQNKVPTPNDLLE
jgi:hypothetical protein